LGWSDGDNVRGENEIELDRKNATELVGLGGKCLEVLKQIAPGVTRTAVLWDFGNPAGIAQFGAIRAMASSLGVDVTLCGSV
jgi:hypothetical protein